MRNDCPDGADEKMCVECDFEKNLCGWRPIPSDNENYNWRLTHPGNWSYNQPPNDTTYGNSSGKIGVLESTPKVGNNHSPMLSP